MSTKPCLSYIHQITRPKEKGLKKKEDSLKDNGRKAKNGLWNRKVVQKYAKGLRERTKLLEGTQTNAKRPARHWVLSPRKGAQP